MAFYKADHPIKYNGEWYMSGDKIKVEDGDEKIVESCGCYQIDGRTGKPFTDESESRVVRKR